MADVVSIEEANKIRVAMGMKPLPVPGGGSASGPVFKESDSEDDSEDEPASTLETRAAAAGDNWKKLQDEENAKAKAQARKEAIKKARDQAQRFAKLEGKSLGEGDDLDAKSWLAGQKKRQKKIEKARRLEQELAEREQQAEYTSADLAGVKVAHELDAFDEGGEQILTLKDAAVDDDEAADELEAADLREVEKANERLESKKRKRVYDPNETAEDGQNTILAQYDEEIEGKKGKAFTLDGQGRTEEEKLQAAVGGTSGKSKSIKISLDMLKEDDGPPPSDYLDPSEIKIKKPKKSKKSKSLRKKAVDEDDIIPPGGAPEPAAAQNGESMDLDVPETSVPAKRKSTVDDNFVDDEDLQAQLAMQRRAALKKRKKMRPEDLARQFREEESATPGVVESTEDGGDEPGLVIDETTEFVANLQKPAEPERRRQKSSQPRSRGVSMAAGIHDEEGDLNMESYAQVEDEEDREARATRSVSATQDVTTTGLDEEMRVDQGLGATLALLRQRGVLQDSNADEQVTGYREHQKFVTQKMKAEEEAERRAKLQRERDRASGRLDNMSGKDREALAQKSNQDRDRLESRKMGDLFNKDYKPNVELKYVDEYGRHMNQKEAFKHLSHQFHGKGSGKQKLEKHLKKIEEEKKKESTSLLDSSQATGMNNAAGATARKNRQAGVRLQ
ncbi:hypothetical protein K490DRAFT_36100 [Saccharata proteae CBS 121410]|uniref:SART-1 protein n=1 Tax=Saccharata proteae CBS 121410 TaxID=1314787 RepID=A0A9P4LYH8_9PEZI|nr:hypothetical protein K490DRAFT_36100 [Saccharata proteae CBS 121410]